MKNIKKTAVLCAAAAIMLCGAVPVFAESADAAMSDDQAAVVPEAVIVPIVKQATLREVFMSGVDGEYYMMIETAEGEEVRLNFDPAMLGGAVPVIDAGTGAVMSAGDIAGLAVGSRIVAAYGPMMTMSIPGQSPMRYMLVNVGDQPPIALYTAEEVAETADGWRVLTDNGGLYISIPRAVWQGKEAPAAGTQFLAWYDVVMESYPGQTTANKAVAVDSEAASVIINCPDGESIKLPDVVEYVNGAAMVPLRVIAEKLGFAVDWNPADMSARLNNGVVQTIVYTGVDSYYRASAIEGMMGMTAPQSYGAAMYLHNKETAYVPVKLFELLGITVGSQGDQFVIG